MSTKHTLVDISLNWLASNYQITFRIRVLNQYQHPNICTHRIETLFYPKQLNKTTLMSLSRAINSNLSELALESTNIAQLTNESLTLTMLLITFEEKKKKSVATKIPQKIFLLHGYILSKLVGPATPAVRRSLPNDPSLLQSSWRHRKIRVSRFTADVATTIFTYFIASFSHNYCLFIIFNFRVFSI